VTGISEIVRSSRERAGASLATLACFGLVDEGHRAPAHTTQVWVPGVARSKVAGRSTRRGGRATEEVKRTPCSGGGARTTR
jgi:hypothetical protein